MKLDAGPEGQNALELSDEIEQLAQRVGRFVADLGDDLDDVELWVRRTSRWGWRIADAELSPDMVPALDEVAIRVFRDGEVGESSADVFDEGAWRKALSEAVAGLAPGDQPLPSTPRARRPGPMTFDADLADALASKRELHRVAYALHDNLWHEASRIDGVRGYVGHIAYTARRYLVGTRNGVVA